MKKLINDPTTVVAEALRGIALAHDLEVHDDSWISRAPTPGKVALVSGGGAGHEPLHAGFVGLGMLDAAVSGRVFTSPPPQPIIDAATAVDSGAGVLLIVKNYTGDVLNFEVAAEMLEMEGVQVATVLVRDDVAVEDSTWTAGRRGVAGTVLVEKMAGAAAEAGLPLAEVAAVAQDVADNVRTMGLALTSCTVPHAGKPSFDIADDEVELGVGIHGEPGRRRVPMATANELIDELIDAILADLDFSGAEVIVLVNGMGATPLSELYLAYGHVVDRLTGAGVTVARSMVGNYVTALDMAGASVTLLRATPQMLEYFDAPVNTPAWRKGC